MVFVFVLLSSFSWVSTERTEKKTHTKKRRTDDNLYLVGTLRVPPPRIPMSSQGSVVVVVRVPGNA